MQRKNSHTFNIAYCSIVTALSVVVMYAAIFPSMTYVFPAISGMLLWTVGEQINKKWALLSYIAASLLCIMVVPEAEANLFFLLFFGYYPIIRSGIQKMKPKILGFIVKLGLFNAAVILIYQIMCLLFSADKMLAGMEDFGEYAVYVLWGFGNVAFLLYDFCLTYMELLFNRWLKPRFNKLTK